MNRYAGKNCPHCGKPFAETDNPVVCPECGAPYHRACFEAIGRTCLFADRHAEGFDWDADQQKQAESREEAESHQNGGIRCGRCGTLNAPDHIFCDVCGAALHQNDPSGTADESAFNPFGNSPFGGGFRAAGFQNPYTTPYGGVNPDDVIEEVPVKDLAIFVGENTAYYLPKFKDLATKNRQVINWSAFLLDFIFLVYRKMYLLAGVIFLITNLIPVAVALFLTDFDLAAITPQSYSAISMLSYGLALAVRVFVGISFNRLYLKHTLRKVKRLRELHPGESDYYPALTKAGSVSRRAVSIVCILYLLLTVFGYYVTVLFTTMM